MKSNEIRSAAAAALAALVSGAAGAETVELHGDVGADSAPYQFLPSLARGGHDTLWAFTDPEGAHSFETFVRFDLPAEWLCGEVAVEQATLRLPFVLDAAGQGTGSTAPGTIECREVLAPWDEATITWANKPAYDAPVDVVTGIADFGEVLCDVTDLVAGWVACEYPNDGFAVTNPTDRLMGFYSFESPFEPPDSDLIQPALIVELPEPGSEGTLAAVTLLAILARLRARGRISRAGRERGA